MNSVLRATRGSPPNWFVLSQDWDKILMCIISDLNKPEKNLHFLIKKEPNKDD